MVPIGVRHVLNPAESKSRSVVDKYVHMPELGLCCCDCRARQVRVRHVGDMRQRPAAIGPDACRNLAARGFFDLSNSDRCALGRE